MNDIVCIEKLNGDRIITEIIERGTQFVRTKNPVTIYPQPAEGKIGFGPYLYTDPKEMTSKLYCHTIGEEHVPAEDIKAAYMEYIRRLTSSIIQLDKNIQKVQLNG